MPPALQSKLLIPRRGGAMVLTLLVGLGQFLERGTHESFSVVGLLEEVDLTSTEVGFFRI